MKTLEAILKGALKEAGKSKGERLLVSLLIKKDVDPINVLIFIRGNSVFYLRRPDEHMMYLNFMKVNGNSEIVSANLHQIPVWPAKSEAFWRDFPEFSGSALNIDLIKWAASK